jgi:hypothetical protein
MCLCVLLITNHPTLIQNIFFPKLSINLSNEQSNGELITKPSKSRLKFPRIAIKLRPGTVTVKETETILGQTVIQRTQEVSDPVTGEPTLQTFEYVEKTIEKEVSVNFFLTSLFFHVQAAKKHLQFFN